MIAGIKIYAVCLPVALLCDALWLGVIARPFYRKHLGYLMTENVVWGAALAFYLMHAAGVIYFCILPALQSHSLSRLIVSSILFGFMTYGTYNLTNWATIHDWPAIVSGVDMLWGASISLIVALAGYYFATTRLCL